jgi:hypothetical protein
MALLQHQPGGYSFIAALPQSGRHAQHAIRKHIADIVLSILYDKHILSVLIQSAFTVTGQPQQPAYAWLLTNIYSGDHRKLYNDWFTVRCKEKQ